MDSDNRVVEEILAKIPRPNYEEIPALYIDLDNMTRRIGLILIGSNLYEGASKLIRFDKASPNDIHRLMAKDPKTMIPFFVMICGFSVRELERLARIHDIYSLRKPETFRKKEESTRRFAQLVIENLRYPLHLETVLYKFYKNWEEHQKRHYRAKIEDQVRKLFEQHGFPCGKIKILCRDKEIEIDGAIPPDPHRVKVALQIRTGVRRDLVKRAKEFSSEYDDILQCLPHVKFIPVYLVPPHEKDKLEEFRRVINNERKGKTPYTTIILTWEELENLLNRLPKMGLKKQILRSDQSVKES